MAKKSTATATATATAMSGITHFHTTLLSLLLLSLAGLLLIHRPPAGCLHPAPTNQWSGDLRDAAFSWNSLPFPDPSTSPPPLSLKIAVFTRKWPAPSSPGGMERHALTLHTALARRGHRVHVFTSGPQPPSSSSSSSSDTIRFHVLPGPWRCGEAWAMYEAEGGFDVVHSESVAVYHRFARAAPNLVVSWHGISLEALHSAIHQDLARSPADPISPAFNRTLSLALYKVLDEIRFFPSYAHHVAISDSAADTLRDVYQIPSPRVHVILNGVDDRDLRPDPALGRAFRREIGLPPTARVVLGVAGRLVKDKGHPLLHDAFDRLASRHPDVYLVVAGAGPWEQRYVDLGPNVRALGTLPPGKLNAFYNAIDVFVNPTLRPQGLDLTLMEAMQCGKPVAATRFPSIKGSVVVHDEFGFMFAPNVAALQNALEAAVREGPARLAERGRACRRYAAEMFAAGKMAMAYERLFLCVKDDRFCKYPLHFD